MRSPFLLPEHQKVIKHMITLETESSACLLKRWNRKCVRTIWIASLCNLWEILSLFNYWSASSSGFLVILLDQEHLHPYFWMTGEIKGYLWPWKILFNLSQNRYILLYPYISTYPSCLLKLLSWVSIWEGVFTSWSKVLWFCPLLQIYLVLSLPHMDSVILLLMF